MTELKHHPSCCGCGATPPPDDEDSDSSTLLSMRFGWRVIRQLDPRGSMSAEWRCPSCWDKYKAARPVKNKGLDRRGP
ncbi:MAG: hypothetical protein ABW133_21065 [Polyangiaceae bacterium]